MEFLPDVVLAAGEKDEKKFCFERPKYLRTESWKTPRVGGTLLLETEEERAKKVTEVDGAARHRSHHVIRNYRRRPCRCRLPLETLGAA